MTGNLSWMKMAHLDELTWPELDDPGFASDLRLWDFRPREHERICEVLDSFISAQFNNPNSETQRFIQYLLVDVPNSHSPDTPPSTKVEPSGNSDKENIPAEPASTLMAYLNRDENRVATEPEPQSEQPSLPLDHQTPKVLDAPELPGTVTTSTI